MLVYEVNYTVDFFQNKFNIDTWDYTVTVGSKTFDEAIKKAESYAKKDNKNFLPYKEKDTDTDTVYEYQIKNFNVISCKLIIKTDI